MKSNKNLLESSFNKIESSFIFLKQRKMKNYIQEKIKSNKNKSQTQFNKSKA